VPALRRAPGARSLSTVFDGHQAGLLMGDKAIAMVLALGIGCRGSEQASAGRSSAAHKVEEARIVILQGVLATLENESRCVAVDRLVVYHSHSLAAAHVSAILRDMSGPSSDPSSVVVEGLRTLRARPMSECPQRDRNPDWFHVRTGPLRLVGSVSAEMVVSKDLDGFPEFELCRAVLASDQWRFQSCVLKAQS